MKSLGYSETRRARESFHPLPDEGFQINRKSTAEWIETFCWCGGAKMNILGVTTRLNLHQTMHQMIKTDRSRFDRP